MAELRSFIFIDQMQPQTMCYLGTWIKGTLPRADMAAQIIEVAPGPYQNFTWYPFLWSAGGEVVAEVFDAVAVVRAVHAAGERDSPGDRRAAGGRSAPSRRVKATWPSGVRR